MGVATAKLPGYLSAGDGQGVIFFVKSQGVVVVIAIQKRRYCDGLRVEGLTAAPGELCAPWRHLAYPFLFVRSLVLEAQSWFGMSDIDGNVTTLGYIRSAGVGIVTLHGIKRFQ